LKSEELIQALSRAGIRRLAGYGDILKGSCPFHQGSAGKTFWVHVDSGVWGCWSTRCPNHSGGNLYKLFTALGYDAAQVQKEVLGLIDLLNIVSTSTGNSLRGSNNSKPSNLKDLDEGGYLRESHIIGWRVNWKEIVNTSELSEVLEFVGSRSIPLKTLEFFEVGFDRDLRTLIFALRDPNSGELRGIARRKPKHGEGYFFSASPVSYKHPNYRYRRVPKGQMLWGYRAQIRAITSGVPIVIVEGFFDVLNLNNYGVCAVAKMGQRLTDAQAQVLLDSGNPLVLWPDRDSAGIRGVSEDVAKLLAAPDLTCVLPRSSDPGEATSLEVPLSLRDAVMPAEFLARVPELLVSVR
jgi:hypothetical protein